MDQAHKVSVTAAPAQVQPLLRQFHKETSVTVTQEVYTGVTGTLKSHQCQVLALALVLDWVLILDLDIILVMILILILDMSLVDSQ